MLDQVNTSLVNPIIERVNRVIFKPWNRQLESRNKRKQLRTMANMIYLKLHCVIDFVIEYICFFTIGLDP